MISPIEIRTSAYYLKKIFVLNKFVSETEWQIGLYPVRSTPELFLAPSTSSVKDMKIYRKLHGVAGIISSKKKNQMLSNLAEYDRRVSKLVTKNLQWVPCIAAKVQKSAVSQLKTEVFPFIHQNTFWCI